MERIHGGIGHIFLAPTIHSNHPSMKTDTLMIVKKPLMVGELLIWRWFVPTQPQHLDSIIVALSWKSCSQSVCVTLSLQGLGAFYHINAASNPSLAFPVHLG